MNYIDIIIAILLIVAAIKGLTKGFIYEIVSLIALIGGVWGAIKFSDITKNFLVNDLTFTNQYIDIIAFIITFVAIIVLVHFLGKAVEKIIKAVALGFINRILGMIFAVFKAAFIIGIIIIVVERIDEKSKFIKPEVAEESICYKPIRNIALTTFPFLQDLYNDYVNTPKKKKHNIKSKLQKI